MIGKLKGVVDSIEEEALVLDVNGVGYLVSASARTLRAIPAVGEPAELLIETHVREDALALYGFLSSREKHFFEMLLSASGVGPSLALKILSGMSVEELVPAIRNSDLARLTKIPGVGLKTDRKSVV